MASQSTPHRHTLAKILALAVAYLVFGKLSLLLAIPPGFATAVWPPAGVALAALMICGTRVWPGIWLGSFLLNSWISWNNGNAITPVGISFAAGIGIGAVVQALVAEKLLRRAAPDSNPHDLDSIAAVLRFVFLGGMGASLIGSCNGVFWLWQAGFLSQGQLFNSWWTWWIGDAIGVMIFTPLVLVWLGRPRQLWRRRVVSVGVPLILAFTTVVIFFFWTSSLERARLEREFDGLAGTLNQSFINELNSSKESLSSLRDLCTLTDPISEKQFDGFAETFLRRRHSAAALAWVERVPNDQRAAFEKVHGEIWEKTAGVRQRDTSNTADYYPILYSEPHELNKGALGFNLAHGGSRRAGLLASASTGELSASSRIFLVQDNPPKTSIQLALPVYKNGVRLESADSREKHLRGFVTLVIRIEHFLNVAMPHDGLGIDIQLFDHSAGAVQDLLYESIHNASKNTSATLFERQTVLNVGGRTWELVLRPTPEYLNAHGSSNSWVVLAGGLVLVSLLGAFLLVLTGRTAHVEVLVAERTAALEAQMTELKLAQDALKTSDARFRSYFELGMVGMAITSPTKGWLNVNDAICRQFGYTLEEMTRLTWAELTHAEDLAADVAQFNRVVAGEIDSYNMDKRFIRKDGSILHAAISVACMRKDDGSIDYFIAMIQDISDRLRARDAIVKAKESAEAASRAKGDFLATMSHEIRTPMNGVIGFTELLLETPLSQEQREYIKAIKTSGHVLLSLINDILDFSKIDAGKMEVEALEFDIEAAIHEVGNLLRAQSQDKGLSLNIEIAKSMNTKAVLADPLRTRQVLLNLIGNAIKFTKQGGITVRVSDVLTDAQGKSFARISVSDTGIGIPRDKQEQLFQKFTQADSSTTRKFGGTGLGLAICKRLVELMGGEIGFESTTGEGSVFWFTLPLAATTSATRGSISIRRPSLSAADLDEMKGCTVLVAEDNTINQTLARKILEKFGCKIDMACNGEEAVRKMRANKYALVFMDCHMPELDGYSATREIRRWEKTTASAGAHTPIIALTANAFKGDQDECLAAGMDDYLTKPVTKEAIRQILEKWTLPL